MIKIAVYGKGGIGKSTTVSNLSAALSEKGLRVMQIGCDPKADSTVLLTHGEKMPTALQLMRERKNDFTLSDMAREGFGGVVCVEAGGPTPGLGCAGAGLLRRWKSSKKRARMKPSARTWCFMTYWATSYAAGFPCRCAQAMPTGSSS